MEKSPNFYDISNERKELRRALDELKEADMGESSVAEKAADEIEALDREAEGFSVRTLGGLAKAKERLVADREAAERSAWLDEAAITEAVPEYPEIISLEEKLASLQDFEMRRLRDSQGDVYARKSHDRLSKTIHEERDGLEARLDAIGEEHPDALRAAELITYKKGLHAEGHIAPLPSVEENLAEIGLRMVTGKPMFLHGPTGTQKKESVDGGVNLQEAKEILGTRFFGPDELKKAGIEVEDVPEIPFTAEQLETAKAKGLDLILFTDKLSDGSPLTGKSLNAFYGGKQSNASKLLYKVDWYANEDFYAKETPELKWKLVSREIIPDTVSKNYLDQTEALAKYVQSLYADENDMPDEVKEALNEFEDIMQDSVKGKHLKAGVVSQTDAEWKAASALLADLKLTKMFRESFAEVFYRLVVIERANGGNLLQQKYAWTGTRSSVGRLVLVGVFGAGGADVGGYGPGFAFSVLGLAFAAEKI